MPKLSVKKFYQSIINESAQKFEINEEMVCDLCDVKHDKDEDFIRIDFSTTYGQRMSLVAKYSQFKNWFSKADKESVFINFVKEFIKKSEENLDEIIDLDNQIIDDDPIPNNATNSMVGNSQWDLEKVYKTLPKVSRMYMGDLGIGMVTW